MDGHYFREYVRCELEEVNLKSNEVVLAEFCLHWWPLFHGP